MTNNKLIENIKKELELDLGIPYDVFDTLDSYTQYNLLRYYQKSNNKRNLNKRINRIIKKADRIETRKRKKEMIKIIRRNKK